MKVIENVINSRLSYCRIELDSYDECIDFFLSALSHVTQASISVCYGDKTNKECWIDMQDTGTFEMFVRNQVPDRIEIGLQEGRLLIGLNLEPKENLILTLHSRCGINLQALAEEL